MVYLIDPSEPEDPLSAEITKAFLQRQDEPGGVEAKRLRYLRDSQAGLQTPSPQDDGASPPHDHCGTVMPQRFFGEMP